MVTVTMNGHKHLLSVRIDPEAMDPEDPSMLEDLVVAAVNEASRKMAAVAKRLVATLPAPAQRVRTRRGVPLLVMPSGGEAGLIVPRDGLAHQRDTGRDDVGPVL